MRIKIIIHEQRNQLGFWSSLTTKASCSERILYLLTCIANFNFTRFKHGMNPVGLNKIKNVSVLKRCIVGAAFCLSAGFFPFNAKAMSYDIFEKKEYKTEQQQDSKSTNILIHILGMAAGGFAGFLLTRIGEGRNEKLLQNPYLNITSGIITGGFLPINTMIASIGGFLGLTAMSPIVSSHNVKERARSIFLEDYSQKEAEQIREKYSTLLKIEDKDSFVEKLFNELCKDYKFEKIPIGLNCDIEEDINNPTANLEKNLDKGYIINLNKKSSNTDILMNLTRQMRYIKQDLIEFQVTSPKEIYGNIYNRLKEMNETANVVLSGEETAFETLKMTNKVINFYENCGVQSDTIKSDNKLYDFGRQIYDSKKYYANKVEKDYDNSFYEKDAISTAFRMKRFVENSLY